MSNQERELLHFDSNAAQNVHGVMAEFDSPEDLLNATKRAYEAGYRRMDAYSPMPVDGLADALGMKDNRVALITLIGGICGTLGGFYLLYWICVVAYPHNVGGRPLNSWPAFIPITFECLILLSALSAMIGMFALNKLPQPYHPVFNVPDFDRASQDRFFLCIESSDPLFRAVEAVEFLREAGGERIAVVPK